MWCWSGCNKHICRRILLFNCTHPHWQPMMSDGRWKSAAIKEPAVLYYYYYYIGGWAGHWPNIINYYEYYYLARPRDASCPVLAVSPSPTHLSFYDEWDWSWSRPFEGCEYRYLHTVGQPALMWIVLGPSRLESWKIDSFVALHPHCIVYLMKIYLEYSTANTAEWVMSPISSGCFSLIYERHPRRIYRGHQAW